MKLQSNHLLNLFEYAKCKGYAYNSDMVAERDFVDASTYVAFYNNFLSKSNDDYFGLHFGFF